MASISGTEDTVALSADGDTRSTEVPPSRLRTGERVDRYIVVGLLGAGGMAEVYRATDERLGRDVALKFVRTLQTEGAACGSLCSLLMREALAAAHTAKIVHRDVKPDNVLVDRRDRVIVSDFGLARSLADLDETGYACGCTGGATVRVQLDGLVVGTPHYMSPEQHEGRAADSRSDQFSFAVTCWETLYGTPPFRGHDLESIRNAVLSQRFEALPTDTDVPGAIADVLRRGMRVSPSARYPNMAAFLERLSGVG